MLQSYTTPPELKAKESSIEALFNFLKKTGGCKDSMPSDNETNFEVLAENKVGLLHKNTVYWPRKYQLGENGNLTP